MSGETLLPCPFCSAEPEVWSDSRRTWGLVRHKDGCLFPNIRKHEIPEEDFAAWNTRADYHGYEQAAIEAWKSIKKWNSRVHGTLTAEQVRETVEKHWHDLPDEYDMPEATALPEYSYDWQAIADELNVALGRGECEVVSIKARPSGSLEVRYSCGHMVIVQRGETRSFCPYCGKAVKR